MFPLLPWSLSSSVPYRCRRCRRCLRCYRRCSRHRCCCRGIFRCCCRHRRCRRLRVLRCDETKTVTAMCSWGWSMPRRVRFPRLEIIHVSLPSHASSRPVFSPAAFLSCPAAASTPMILFAFLPLLSSLGRSFTLTSRLAPIAFCTAEINAFVCASCYPLYTLNNNCGPLMTIPEPTRAFSGKT